MQENELGLLKKFCDSILPLNAEEWNAKWLKSQHGATRLALHFLENGKRVEKK